MKFFSSIILFFSIQGLAQKSEVISEYIASYQQLAMAEQIRTGIPAAITLAQGIHESGAGQGDLALRSNNHFGVKCKSSWGGEKVYHDDDASGECFRAYTCVADSYYDHSDFLKNSKRYSFLFNLDVADYKGWASGLKQAGYATNPKYPQILIRIIEENNLATLTETAMQQEPGSEVWLAASKTNASAQTAVPETPVVATVATKQVADKKTSPPPGGVFKINHCKVVFAESGTSLKKLATQHGIKYADLLAYNDMKAIEKLSGNQLIFLEKKRKKGSSKTYEVQKGETAWLISQKEGIQLQKLVAYNRLSANSKLKAGQVLYLKAHAHR